MMINVSFFCTASDGKILEVLMIQNKTAISKVSWRLDAKRNCKDKYIIEQTMGFKQLELKKTSYGRFGREKLTRININVTKKNPKKKCFLCKSNKKKSFKYMTFLPVRHL